MQPHCNPVGVVILAAGESSRMGRPKQLLPFRGTTLIRHAAQIALNVDCGPVIVTLGANSSAIQKELRNLKVHRVFNAEWSAGMQTSIHAGVQRLLELAPGARAVILMCCDQPFLDEQHLRNLLQAFNATKQKIVASAYGGTVGIPALFANSYFEQLLRIENGGAKQLFRNFYANISTVPFANGDVDLDTPEDFENFLKMPADSAEQFAR